MLTPTLMLVAALSTTSMAAPDKFWLEAPDAAAAEGSQPAVIQGVLIEEDDHSLLIRVVGGEIRLDRAQVVRVEKDRMTVETIEREEREAAAARAEREAAEAARAAASAESSDEAAAPQAEWVVEVPAPRAEVHGPGCDDLCTDGRRPCPPFYDPVPHILRVDSCVSDYTLIRDLDFAYRLTKDRTYLKMLRILRRLR